MPTGGIMTLADVVDAGYRGRLQSEHTAEMDRAKKQRGVYDLAGQRAQQAIEAERQQWVSGGGDPAKFRPSDTTMLKASEAFGQTLAEGGDFQGYLKNEASIQPHRLRIRQQALQRYRMDGDKTKLLKTVYATIPDGQEIADVQEVTGGPAPNRGTNPTATPAAPPKTLQQGLADYENDLVNPMANPVSGANEAPVQPIQPGTPGDGRLGAPSGKSKLRVKTSGGDVRDVDFDQFLAGVQQLQMDPMKEIELNYQRALAQAREGAKTDNIMLRGDQARQTEGVKSQSRQTLAMANFNNAMKRDEANNAASMERVKTQQEGANQRTNTRVNAGGSGKGGSGSADSLALRAAQQERLRIQGKRDDARRTYLAQSKDEYDANKKAALKAAYDRVVQKLDQEDAALKSRINTIGQKGGGKSSSGASPAAQPIIDRYLGD